jgi:hypothetical protein
MPDPENRLEFEEWLDVGMPDGPRDQRRPPCTSQAHGSAAVITRPGLVALELAELQNAPRGRLVRERRTSGLGSVVQAPPRRMANGLVVERRSSGVVLGVGGRAPGWPKPATQRSRSWTEREARIAMLERGAVELP